jgi:hypothetical protein
MNGPLFSTQNQAAALDVLYGIGSFRSFAWPQIRRE